MGIRITTIDTNGIKGRPLVRGELGYDDFADKGRVYVGTTVGTDIPLAKLSEVEALRGTVDTFADSIQTITDNNLARADKYLAAQNIASMLYTNGDLSKIQYNTATDTDYEVFSYTNGDLTSIAHYVDAVLKGTTTLTYTDGSLASVVFVGV